MPVEHQDEDIARWSEQLDNEQQTSHDLSHGIQEQGHVLRTRTTLLVQAKKIDSGAMGVRVFQRGGCRVVLHGGSTVLFQRSVC